LNRNKKLIIASILFFAIVVGIVLCVPTKRKVGPYHSTIITKAINRLPAFVSSKILKDNQKIEIHDCAELKLKIKKLAQEKELNNLFEERFTNIHKEIDGKIYRLRYFKKEHMEGERPRFILYEEDQNEDAHMIENTDYVKGPNYKKIEKEPGEILYSEKGMVMGENNHSLFLHFINGELKSLQGSLPEFTAEAMMDCQY